MLTGEYGGKAGFRHVLDGLGIELADGTEDLAFSLVQLCASATGKPLTDDELRLIPDIRGSWRCCFPGSSPRRADLQYTPCPCEGAILDAGARNHDSGRVAGAVTGSRPRSARWRSASLLAFGWNILVSQPHDAAGAESGITRQVGRTVDEVAAKAWASARRTP